MWRRTHFRFINTKTVELFLQLRLVLEHFLKWEKEENWRLEGRKFSSRNSYKQSSRDHHENVGFGNNIPIRILEKI